MTHLASTIIHPPTLAPQRRYFSAQASLLLRRHHDAPHDDVLGEYEDQ